MSWRRDPSNGFRKFNITKMQRFVATKFLGRFEDNSGVEGDFDKSLSGLGKWVVTER